ncbi:MAG: peptidyl-prolyl cis-trans isomerase [Deltaproteobacteria bacterium]|nr:peptidyl-prolyl cis-trans isomerase [Deltaproteobacteria bacterium]
MRSIPRTAILGLFLALFPVLTPLGCNDLTAPRGEDPGQLPPLPSKDRGTNKPRADTIAASHILIAFKGATRASPKVTRSKDEARTEAVKLAAQARAPGADFEALAKANSDDPGSGANGGKLGSFTRESMTKKFSDAAFALAVGQISDVVETEFGFHIIKRTQ